MRKIDLVNQIADKTGLPKVDVMLVVENLINEIRESVAKGESVYLRGFGSFIIKKKGPKLARNINKNTALMVPAHYAPFFKPSPEFVNEVKNSKVITDSSLEDDGENMD